MAQDRTKLVPISAEVEQELRDLVKSEAILNDRSFSAEVRRALRIFYLPQSLKKSA